MSLKCVKNILSYITAYIYLYSNSVNSLSLVFQKMGYQQITIEIDGVIGDFCCYCVVDPLIVHYLRPSSLNLLRVNSIRDSCFEGVSLMPLYFTIWTWVLLND